MKKIILILIFANTILNAEAQQWEWARALSANGPGASVSIKGISASTNGVYIWSDDYYGIKQIRFFTGTGSNSWNLAIPPGMKIKSMTADNTGSLLITGQYNDTLQLSGWTYIAKGYNDIFLMKLMPNGLISFIKSFGWTKDDDVYTITTDSLRNIYFATNLIDSINIEGLWAIRDTSRTESVVVKLDPSGAAISLFKESHGVFHYSIFDIKICIDAANNILFGSNIGYYVGYSYVKLIDPSGVVLADYNINDWLFDIALDHNSYYIMRNYGSHYSSEPGLLRCDNHLNTIWSKFLGGSYDTYEFGSIVLDDQNNIFLSGRNGNSYFGYSGTNVFGNDTLEYSGPETPIIAKINSSGAYADIFNAEIPGGSYTHSSPDQSGNLYVEIRNGYDTTFIVASDTLTLGPGDFTLLKLNYNSLTTSISKVDHQNDQIKIWPNPSPGIFNISLPKTKVGSVVKIYNSKGEEIYFRNTTGAIHVDLSSNPNGMYFLVAVSENSRVSRKLIINR